MRIEKLIKKTGITEGEHSFKIISIKPLTYSEDVAMDKRIAKVIIQGLIDNKIIHSCYLMNERQEIDGNFTMSMYDNVIISICEKANIEIEDTEDYDTLNILLHGFTLPCYALNNKADNGKTYCNVTFTKTDKYQVWEKLQMLAQ